MSTGKKNASRTIVAPKIKVMIGESIPCADLPRRLNQIYTMALARYKAAMREKEAEKANVTEQD